jgi:light-regulated signal transduction histidine kinase (bacteriophytochrome)/CheY-like chemotaxis protein
LVDLTNCDREPIHIPGAIQSFGFLIAVSPDWLIGRLSTNIGQYLSGGSIAWLGRPLSDVLSPAALHGIRNLVTKLRGTDATERLSGLRLTDGGSPFDLAVHYSGSALIIEAEQSVGDTLDAATLVRSMVGRLDQITDMAAFLREGARQIRALIGFDRVMVYRFDSSGSGEVVGEAIGSSVESFLGLNYPASDIPAQARALYLRNAFRMIADVRSTAVPVLPAIDLRGDALDLSLSILRAVSPMHIEYLRNMEVGASASISLIVEGRLWGLIACHHHAPRLPTFAQRGAAELFGRIFSMTLENRERHLVADYEVKARLVADRLMAAVAGNGDLLRDAVWLSDVISGTIPSDGVSVSIDGDVLLSGATPTPEQMASIVVQLNQTSGSQIFATDCISAQIPSAADYANLAAGMLAIPISRVPRDYVILFRRERQHAVRWSGKPEKQIEYGPNGPRLTPRKSFEEWSELVKGTSLPFTGAEKRVAETLRVALLEVVLQLSDSAGRDRRRAHDHQQLLIAELNHRVRNILSLIRGLISQTRNNALSSDAFVERLDGRVQALARAHDQLTADRWGPARLIDLIRTETEAFLGDRQDRVVLSGPNILVDPTAFTVVALVIHELVTNATKYGALSDDGIVSIEWKIAPDGRLVTVWREAGGPIVATPTRKGFGTTIIEHSIPYDLGGEASLEYHPAGFEARFSIPPRFLGDILPDAPMVASMAREASRPAERVLEGCSVLLVEDSMIIALDGEDILRSLGACDVYIASSVERAVAFIDGERIDHAILDFNLGDETSLVAAEMLLARGIPFAFATGYGDALDIPKAMRGVQIIRKPYNAGALSSVIGISLSLKP